MSEEDDDVLSIMISTDSHMGYCERDAIRMNDSFAAFEEVLKLSREKQVDMMLLGGDLFHDNKPSRRTMRNAVHLFEKYVLGDDPVQFEILSNQKKNFGAGGGNRVNYEHPHMSIALPIFSIHGNHDDPTGDGGPEALAALDILSASRLINYFGRQDRVDSITISPILIRKKNTRLAIYGLGNVRDERLNRSWEDDKVTFLRPAEDEEHDIIPDDDHETNIKQISSRFFNILVLHQNRAVNRGIKTSIEERMIPKWIDLVIWGHEHECNIEIRSNNSGDHNARFYISQPGSTVATSLVAGEAVPKHCGILKIKGLNMKMQVFPLTMVRPFVTDDIILAQVEELAEARDRGEFIDESAITQAILNKVDTMIEVAKESLQSPRYPDQEFLLLQPELSLIRLRIDHRGFSKVNSKNLGASFVNKLANPDQVLLFSRTATKKDKNSSKNRQKSNGRQTGNDEHDDYDNEEELDIDEEELGTNQLAALVKGRLLNSQKRLSLLDETKMLEALDQYVNKMEARAFEEVVEKQLEDSKEHLRTDAPEADDEIEKSLAFLKAVNADKNVKKKSAASTSKKRGATVLDSDSEDNTNDAVPPPKRKAKKVVNSSDEDESLPPPKKKPPTKRRRAADSSDEDLEEIVQKPKSARPRRTAVTKAKTYLDDSESDEDESEVVEPPKKRTTTRKRSRYDDDEDDDDESLPTPKKKASTRKPVTKKPAARTSRKKEEQIDLTIDSDDSD